MADSNNNSGCIIGIVMLVIASFIYFFATSSSESIAEFGGWILGVLAFGVICYIIYKVSDRPGDNNTTPNSSSSDNLVSVSSSAEDRVSTQPEAEPNKKMGCFVATLLVALVAGIVTAAMSDFEITYVVGIVGVIVFAAIIIYAIVSSN